MLITHQTLWSWSPLAYNREQKFCGTYVLGSWIKVPLVNGPSL